MIGDRIGSYEIIAPLGSGGMGEVYRARDTQLKREVAIKVLPDAFAQDPERLGRFQREAELLATLNHPNIAAVYGVERTSGVNAIVLELVEGETLADRLQRGALPLQDTLTIARQIVEAMEAAHEKGIVHRDLKPANVKVTPDDRVKVLDFGLARAMTDEPAPTGAPILANATHSPTLSMLATQAGVILGTAAYMSPEQAKGLPADHRSDVFSFGCVLYEMLTGRQPFHGETAPDILASVVARDPDFAAVPPSLNPRLLELLKRCLAKQPKRRWQAAGDLRMELETIAAGPIDASVVVRPARRSWLRLGAAGLALAIVCAAGGAVLDRSLRRSNVPDVARLSLVIPDGQRITTSSRRRLAISRDGKQLAYIANGQLFVRRLSQTQATPLSDARLGVLDIAFSPDGQQIAYFSVVDRTLKRVAVVGGPAIALERAGQTGQPAGISWDDGGILLGGRAIVRLDPDGGTAHTLVQLGADEVAYRPEMLPGGRAVLFTLFAGTATFDAVSARVVAQALGSKERTIIAEGGSDAHYIPTGHVVYGVGGVLFARSFDLARLHASGSATPVVEGIERGTGAVGVGVLQYSVADSGTMVYASGPAAGASNQRRIVMIDRDGKPTLVDLAPGAYESPRFSPDGTRLALMINEGRQAQIHVYDLSGRASLRQLTFEGRNTFPVWSPDGQRILFQSTRDGDSGIWWQRADGTGVAERLTRSAPGGTHVPESFVGRTGTFSFSDIGSDGSVTLHLFSIADRKTTPLGDLSANAPFNSEFSPDGHWMAYTLRNAAGANVYVQPMPPTGAKYVVPRAGGHHPEWSRDGGRLLYFPAGDPIVSVPVTTTNGFAFGNPEPVPGGFISLTSTQSARNHDLSPDGSPMVTVLPDGDTLGRGSSQNIEVVLNWTEELKQKVGGNSR